MISVQNISKTFGDVNAVVDLSFEVKEGEILGLLGPNGAGKTTTMRVMSGYYSPDKGDVLIENVSVVRDTTKAQMLLGYLPENNPLYQDMLVSDFLNYAGFLSNLDAKVLKEGLKFVTASVNLKDVYYRPIKELSKGYRQRVGIAAALLHRPKVLIMDEPTEGLDPNQRNEIRSLIKEIAKEHTIVISTHVMQEVEAICSRMIIIDKGKKVADGTVDELVRGNSDEIVYEVELEGTDVANGLKVLDYAQISQVSSSGNRTKLKIVTPKDRLLQPALSALVSKYSWTVWGLNQKVLQLEQVFRDLTNNA